jgi:Sortase domain
VVRQIKTWWGGARGLVACALTAALLALTACSAVPPALQGFVHSATPTPAATPNPLRPGKPVRISIATIGLDWPVVPVGRDATGAMETPQGPESAPSWREGFWWQYGYLAGQPGNAVIAGHVDDVGGNLTPFARISELTPGDIVTVRTDAGSTLRFQVTNVATVPNPVGGPTDPTITSIFGPATTANLNLITCTGDWVGNEFDQRLVIYTTLVTTGQASS